MSVFIFNRHTYYIECLNDIICPRLSMSPSSMSVPKLTYNVF